MLFSSANSLLKYIPESSPSCILNGKTEDEVWVHLLGGDLLIRYDRQENRIYMTGPATTVFDGEYTIE